MLVGESRPLRGGLTGVIETGFVALSISDVPPLEIDAWVDPGIDQVRDQADDEAKKREDIERRENDRVVAIDHREIAEAPEPIERKDVFDQERAGEEGGDESAREAGNDDQHGVAEDM